MSNNVISFEDHLFGRVAVSLGFVTPQQLRDSLQVMGNDRDGRSLGKIMLAEGLLDEEKVRVILHVQRKKRCKHVPPEQQHDEERALGEAIITEGLVGLDELESSLLEKERLARKHIHLHLGEVLVNRGVLEESDVRRILRTRRGEIRRCGACDLTFHVASGVPRERWTCSRCGSALEAVGYLQLIEADGDVS